MGRHLFYDICVCNYASMATRVQAFFSSDGHCVDLEDSGKRSGRLLEAVHIKE